MKIQSISLISGMSGKISKSEDIVFSNRYGNIYAWRVRKSDKELTPAQQAHQARFASAHAQAVASINDPQLRPQWEAKVADGSFKTVMGAAMSHFMRTPSED